jgi:hypothetical protein
MKFLAAILLFTSAVAAASKDDDAWISYKVLLHIHWQD